jgi:hypothetical protein
VVEEFVLLISNSLNSPHNALRVGMSLKQELQVWATALDAFDKQEFDLAVANFEVRGPSPSLTTFPSTDGILTSSKSPTPLGSSSTSASFMRPSADTNKPSPISIKPSNSILSSPFLSFRAVFRSFFWAGIRKREETSMRLTCVRPSVPFRSTEEE